MPGPIVDDLVFPDPAHPPTVSLVEFESGHKGVKLLRTVISKYLISWWGFVVKHGEDDSGDIIIINEDPTLVETATSHGDISRPFIILSGSRGDARVMAIASEHERIGGFCRVLYKPGGPSRLQSVMKVCLHILKTRPRPNTASPDVHAVPLHGTDDVAAQPMIARPSEKGPGMVPPRPDTASITPLPEEQSIHTSIANGISHHKLPPTLEVDEPTNSLESDLNTPDSPTVPVGSGASLLKSSIGSIKTKDLQYRVLVVEDNNILRNLLCVVNFTITQPISLIPSRIIYRIKWLKSKGHYFRDASDGRKGVDIFESEGPFE